MMPTANLSAHVPPPDTARKNFLLQREISLRVNPVAVQPERQPLPRGAGHLTVERVAGQSAATSVWATSPLKILVPQPRGESVWAYMSSFGGGLVAGDETSISVNVASRAKCFLSTQASTKVYRNPAARPCGHRLNATVGADALFVLAPDPVQAFAGSGYVQRQEFRLDARAGLVLVDWVSAGRTATGERWAFDRYQSRSEVFLDGKRVFLDSLLLDSEQTPLVAAHRLGRYNCVAFVLVFGETLTAPAEKILAEISARPVVRRARMVCSASAVGQGALVRLAGESIEEVGREIHRLLAFLPELLHDDPWARKW